MAVNLAFKKINWWSVIESELQQYCIGFLRETDRSPSNIFIAILF